MLRQDDKAPRKVLRWILLFILEGSWFCLLNFLTPLLADDYSLALRSRNGLLGIFQYLYNMYFTWGSRMLAHFFAICLLHFDKWVFNLANTAVFVVFARLCFFHATCGLELTKKQQVLYRVLLHAVLFLYVANWGQVFLWLDGACNYLWTGTVMLGFLKPYRRQFDGPGRRSRWMIPGMFLLGIAAGWCNENTSGGVILLAAAFTAWGLVEKRRPQPWMYAGLVGALGGFAAMIAAPGNYVRADMMVSVDSTLANAGLLKKLVVRAWRILMYCFNTYKPLYFVLIAAVILLLFLRVEKKKLFVPLAFAAASAATSFALMLSQGYSGRVQFGSTVFLAIAVVSAAALLGQRDEKGAAMTAVYAGILTFAALVNFCDASIDIISYYLHAGLRDSYVAEQIESGSTNVVANILSLPKTKYCAAYGLDDIGPDPSVWPTYSYAGYFGVSTATGVPEEIFDSVFRDGDYALMDCRDIHEYLRQLQGTDRLVVMAVNGDSSQALDDETAALLSGLGLKTDLRAHERWSYLAVLDGGDVVSEQYDGEVLNYFDTVSGQQIEAQSSGRFYDKGVASIRINGFEYARDSTGLNIVVFDKDLGRVVDRVAFNTSDGLTCSR